MNQENITQELLKSLFDYNPSTGVLQWKTKTGQAINIGDEAGCIRENGYRYVGLYGGQYLAHRLIWLLVTGDWPKDMIDHINNDRTDNRWSNLREATGNQNQWNRSLNANNKTGFKGIYKKGDKFVAQIGYKSKIKHIGYFNTAEDAHLAYLDFANKLHGQYNKGF